MPRTSTSKRQLPLDQSWQHSWLAFTKHLAFGYVRAVVHQQLQRLYDGGVAQNKSLLSLVACGWPFGHLRGLPLWRKQEREFMQLLATSAIFMASLRGLREGPLQYYKDAVGYCFPWHQLWEEGVGYFEYMYQPQLYSWYDIVDKGIELGPSEWKKANTMATVGKQQQNKNARTNRAILSAPEECLLMKIVAMTWLYTAWIGLVGSY